MSRGITVVAAERRETWKSEEGKEKENACATILDFLKGEKTTLKRLRQLREERLPGLITCGSCLCGNGLVTPR